MEENPLLRRLVVVGGDDQKAVGARGVGLFGQCYGLARAVGTRPGEHGHAPARRFYDELYDVDVLGGVEAADSPLYLRFHKPPEPVVINAIGGHRRDERRPNS